MDSTKLRLLILCCICRVVPNSSVRPADTSDERLGNVTYVARRGPRLLNMTVIDSDKQGDREKILQHAQNIKSCILEKPILYHTMWIGPLNANTLTSIKACYYFNIQVPSYHTSQHREIWFWVSEFSNLGNDPLHDSFLPYVKFKNYTYMDEVLGTPFERSSWFRPQHAPNDVVNLARVIFLYKYGGFYFDLDMLTLRNWDPLLGEYPEQMLVYAWERQNYPNNAFLYSPARHPTLEALFKFTIKTRCSKFGFKTCQLTYQQDVPMTVLPCRWFDDGWLPGSFGFDNFFDNSPRTFDVPGAFGYHWHNQWRRTPQKNSPFSQFAQKINTLLSQGITVARLHAAACNVLSA